MQTMEELKAKQAKELAKLETEHAIAAACPLAPKRVMEVGTGERAWISYSAPDLRGALAIMAAFQPLAFGKFKGTYTRYEPEEINAKRTRDKGEEIGGPYVAALNVNQGEGFGPSADFCFFARIGGDVCKVRVDIESGYVGTAPQYGAGFVRNDRGSSRRIGARNRYVIGDFVANSAISSMAETYTKWASGSRESCHFVYVFGADYMDDDTGVAGYDVDAIYRLENLATLLHGEAN